MRTEKNLSPHCSAFSKQHSAMVGTVPSIAWQWHYIFYWRNTLNFQHNYLKSINTEHKIMHFSVNQKPLFLSQTIAKAHKNGRRVATAVKISPRSVNDLNNLLESCSSHCQVQMRKQGKQSRRTVAQTHPFQPPRKHGVIIQFPFIFRTKHRHDSLAEWPL